MEHIFDQVEDTVELSGVGCAPYTPAHVIVAVFNIVINTDIFLEAYRDQKQKNTAQ